MFPNSRTKISRQQSQAAFSKDIARCNLIIKDLTQCGNGDLMNMIHTLPAVHTATIDCYAGNCSNCPAELLVCSGVDEGCWWVKSAYLPTRNITRLEMDDNDKSILALILEMRLSETAVKSVSLNTSTQKAEAFNRAAIATMPKEINFSRNFSGRLAAQTLKSNNSVAEAVK